MHYAHKAPSEAARIISDRVLYELKQGAHVVLLVSGGSNTAIAATVINNIPEEASSKLAIGQIDERYGAIGHEHSNWKALLDTGVDFKNATVLPILVDGQDRQSTAALYNDKIQKLHDSSYVFIAILGIGTDGHTAGILPNSPAAVETDKLVLDYVSSPFERITLSFNALRQLDSAYLLAFGEDKASVLETLKTLDLPLTEQPAQIIKQITDSYVYNDVVEGVTT